MKNMFQAPNGIFQANFENTVCLGTVSTGLWYVCFAYKVRFMLFLQRVFLFLEEDFK